MSAGELVAGAAAAGALALAIVRRRGLGAERVAGLVLVALALAVYASGVLSQLPDAKTVIDDVAQALGPWTYAAVGTLAFLETGAFVGLVAPGETAVIGAGVIAGQGEIDIVPLIGLVWACAVLGDTTSFFIGRRMGRGFILRHGPRVKITPERLAQVESYLHRHGGKTVLIGRFIGFVRAMAPFVVGSSRIPYRRFVPYSIVGTGLWAAIFSLLGFLFYRSFDRVESIAGRATLAFGVTVAVVVALVYAYRRLRRPEDRHALRAWIARQGERPLLRPLYVAARPVYRGVVAPAARAAAPRVRFVRARLRPGALGLELTTAAAVAAIGLYVFFLYVVVLADDPGPTPFDLDFLDLANDLRSGVVVDVAKVVTELGSLLVTAAVALAACAALALNRRPYEVAVLLAGSGLVYAGVHVTKAATDRSRPAGPLVDTALSSFPSGHAAYAVVWVAVAIALTRSARLVGRAALVSAAIAIAVLIGLSRVYLRAHFWSDVAAGWGLGAGCFALCAAVALIVAFIRNNAPRAA